MPRTEPRFLSAQERKKEEALARRYRQIGIPAVAAAKAVRQQAQASAANPSLQQGWLEEHLPQQG